MANHDTSTPLPDTPNNELLINTIKQLIAPIDANIALMVDEVRSIQNTANEAHKKASEATNIAT